MRVLFVTGEYPAMQGGVGDYTHRLGQALGVLGAEVHVLTHVDAGGDHLRAPDGTQESATYEPAVYPRLGKRGWNLWRQVLRMVDEVKPDVVHIQYQSAAYGLHPAVNFLPSRLHLKHKHLPVAVTFHDLKYPYLFPKAGPLRWQSVLRLAKDADAAVATNPADWMRLHDAGLRQKLRAIPIGSNIRCEVTPGYDRAVQRAKWGANGDTWLLAYFGFLNANKGGETLIETLAELVRRRAPAHLLMVGGKVGSSDPTNTAYLQKVEKLIDERGLVNRVHWTGFTTPVEVSANLLAADCAVLPYREGASLRHGSLMAALAHGLPIVSTTLTGCPAEAMKQFPMLEHGENALLTPPEDPMRMADAITHLMTGGALHSLLAAKAAVLSREFEWETIAQGHLNTYQSLGL